MVETPAPELQFRFVAEPLALAFTATVGERWRARFERLRTPADLVRWLREAGLIGDERHLTANESTLQAARGLREAIYAVAKAWADRREDEPPRLSALAAQQATINDWSQRPAAGRSLRTDADGQWSAVWTDATIEDLLSELARQSVDLLTTPMAARIRECSADDCALLYVDTSRSAPRRWCSMKTCGSRAKVSAYRARATAR